MNGTRNAGALWETTSTHILLDLGFRQGVSPPCVFHHDGWGIALVVHGDDFTALGIDSALDTYGQGMANAFDVELRSNLGVQARGINQMELLNKTLRITSRGFTYEADVRHASFLAQTLGLERCNFTPTPGNKNDSYAALADGGLANEGEAQQEVLRFVNALVEQQPPGKTVVRSSPPVEIIDVPCALTTCRYHPRDFVVDGVVEDAHLRRIAADCDPYTGLLCIQAQRRQETWIPNVARHEHVLRNVLVEGPAWETPTHAILAALSATPTRKKFVKRRRWDADRLSDLGSSTQRATH